MKMFNLLMVTVCSTLVALADVGRKSVKELFEERRHLKESSSPDKNETNNWNSNSDSGTNSWSSSSSSSSSASSSWSSSESDTTAETTNSLHHCAHECKSYLGSSIDNEKSTQAPDKTDRRRSNVRRRLGKWTTWTSSNNWASTTTHPFPHATEFDSFCDCVCHCYDSNSFTYNLNPSSGSDSSSSSSSSSSSDSSWSSGKKSSSGNSGNGKTSSSGGKWNTDGGCGGSSSGSSSWSSGKKTSSSGKASSSGKWSTDMGSGSDYGSGTATNRPCSLTTTGARDDSSDYSTTQISCDCDSTGVTSTADEPQVTECTGGNYIVLDGGWEMYSVILDESLTLDGKYNQDDDDGSFSFTREDGLAGIRLEQETNGNEYYLIVGDVTSDAFELMYKTGISLWTQDDNPLINSNDESEWEPFVDETLEFITSNMTFYNCRDEKVESEEFVGWTNYFDNYNDAGKWNLMFVLAVTVFNLFYFLA